ncbi:hypothetical protein D3C83_151170 [compost metagenome]
MGLPHPAVGGQPVVDLGQRFQTQAVPTARPVDPDGHQPGIAQHAQVLRRERLGQPEILGQLADQAFAGS